MTIRPSQRFSQNIISEDILSSKFEIKIPMKQLQEPKGDSENSEFSSEKISSGSENSYEDGKCKLITLSFSRPKINSN
jgi:hypothetical protein